MAYLAGVISASEGFFPVTDTSSAIADLARPAGSLKARLNTLRYAAVLEALPMPARPVPPSELAQFKEKHSDNLRRLRTHLDSKLVELAAIDNEEQRTIKTAETMQEIRDDVALLREQMAKRQWPKVILVGVDGILGGALATASTLATGGGALAVGLAVGGGLAALGGNFHQLVELVRTTRFNDRAPYIYAALAQDI